MIEVLEEIIEDEKTNPTARCTAIRTLREIQASQPQENGRFAELDAFRSTRQPRR
jgi:hypothetical protein